MITIDHSQNASLYVILSPISHATYHNPPIEPFIYIIRLCLSNETTIIG